MRNYKKKRENIYRSAINLSADELIDLVVSPKYKIHKKGAVVLIGCVVFSLFMLISHAKNTKSLDGDGLATISLANVPISATSTKKELISIPTGTVKANPFLPYRDISGSTVSDVPKYDLVAPPEVINENSDAARVMDTIVSGILYDKFSPSAILNIEGNDYLVKKGDVVNNYKVLNILQDSVTVKLGNNVYKAGIGEILTEGTLNHNDVSNLSKKFGGEKR